MSDRPAPAGVGPASPVSKIVLGDKEFVPLTLERVRQLFAKRYDVVRELGSGGTAIVYLAHDREQDRRVAIKVLRPELSAAVIAARFLREIDIGKQLIHPNVLPIEEWGTVEGELYCTMPFVDGETLQERMARETHLPLSEALRIARAVADALDCAHQAGLIHRDIKPGNILLSGDRVFVADFGIARAMSAAATSELTDSGIVIGTAPYMSPEQGSAEKSLDGRTDIYSLGCVVYEMLGGEPPFTGPTARAIIARHAQEAPRSLRVIRPTVPLGVQRAVEKALAKVPADRFATAGAFTSALEAAATRPDELERPRVSTLTAVRRHPVWAALAAAAIAGAAWWFAGRVQTSHRATVLMMLDTTRYIVIAADTVTGTKSAASAVRDALEGWSGITVVERPRSTGGEGRVEPVQSALTDSAARAIAIATNAGRYVRVDAIEASDSVRIHGALVDARKGTPIADAVTRATSVSERSAAAANALVEQLLFPDATEPGTSRSDVGTHSVPARRAFLRGQAAVGEWRLAVADSEFRRATELDAKYASAALWLAQVRQWSLAPVTQWQFAADQAMANDTALTRPARQMAQALSELARGRRDTACGRWSDMTRVDGVEFVPWYSLGNCLRYDSLVVRDSRSLSGWRFRTSYQAAIDAYEESYRRFPPERGSLSLAWFQDVRDLLGVKGPKLRTGRAQSPDSSEFLALATWHAESVQFTPLPRAQFSAGREQRSAAVRDATAHQRQRLLNLARMWRARRPTSASAREAVAVALDLLGNASAVDTLREARRIAETASDRVRMTVTEVWMRVKRSVPDDLDGLRAARALADSLLRDTSAMPQSGLALAGLAALTGHANASARYARLAGLDGVPPGLEQVAPSLLAYAAMGRPRDSVHVYGANLASAIGRTVPIADRATTRARWLVRAASLAAPDGVLNDSLRFEERDSRLEQLLDAWRRRDATAARSLLLDLRRQRGEHGVRPEDVTLDVVYTEASILAALGDSSDAIDWLNPTLESISSVAPESLNDVTRAASLVRAMALRAALASDAGERVSARRWARPVLVLWSGSDKEFLPLVNRMRTLAER